MADIDEIVQTVERLDREFTELVLQGLRAVGAKHLTSLAALRDEFARIGAAHLSDRIGTLISAIKADDRSAAEALMKAQTSLRVFERLLTLQAEREMLTATLTYNPEGQAVLASENETVSEDEEDD
jgi:hypothetical protein